jgi:hypothetical protein
VAGFAVGFRLPFSLLIAEALPYYMGLLIMLLVLIPPVIALGMVAEALPDHRGDCWARLAMIVGALALATNGFWLRGTL